MSKVTLEFNLEDPEDDASYMQMVRAKDLIAAVWEFDQELRLKIKYPPDCLPDNILNTYQEIRELLWGKLEEYKVDLGE